MYLAFKDNIWGADLADIHSISKSKKGFRFKTIYNNSFKKWLQSNDIVMY